MLQKAQTLTWIQASATSLPLLLLGLVSSSDRTSEASVLSHFEGKDGNTVVTMHTFQFSRFILFPRVTESGI